MAHTYTRMLLHLVFATKDRRPWLVAPHCERVHAYMATVFNAYGHAVCLGGPADHVHVLTDLAPTAALADVMRELKSNSATWVHREFPQLRDFAWQQGYGAFSVSEFSVAQVIRYIEQQEEHHRRTTFEEELKLFLKKYNVSYDPERFLQ